MPVVTVTLTEPSDAASRETLARHLADADLHTAIGINAIRPPEAGCPRRPSE